MTDKILVLILLVGSLAWCQAEAAEVSGSFGSLMSEHPDWKVVSGRVNGNSPLTWYARVNLYSDKGSACAGGMYDGERFFGGAGFCRGGTDDKYVGTRNRYNLFGGVYVGKSKRFFITIDHESNCRSALHGTGDKCLWLFHRGPQDKANKALNFLKGGFKFKTGGH